MPPTLSPLAEALAGQLLTGPGLPWYSAPCLCPAPEPVCEVRCEWWRGARSWGGAGRVRRSTRLLPARALRIPLELRPLRVPRAGLRWRCRRALLLHLRALLTRTLVLAAQEARRRRRRLRPTEFSCCS